MVQISNKVIQKARTGLGLVGLNTRTGDWHGADKRASGKLRTLLASFFVSIVCSDGAFLCLLRLDFYLNWSCFSKHKSVVCVCACDCLPFALLLLKVLMDSWGVFIFCFGLFLLPSSLPPHSPSCDALFFRSVPILSSHGLLANIRSVSSGLNLIPRRLSTRLDAVSRDY